MDDSNEWPLAFEQHDRRPVLALLHAFPLDRRMWRRQCIELDGLARVIAFDLPGFGESPAGPNPASLDAWADIVEDVLDALVGDEPVVVAGLSMGGYVALRIADRRPGRLAGLVLADTRAAADTAEARAARDQAIFSVRRRGVEALGHDLLPKLLSCEARPEIIERARSMMLDQRPEAVAAALTVMRDRPDSRPVLPRLNVPVLVMVGEEDTLTPPDEAEAMARAIPGAWLIRIPGAGHLANLEAPEAFNRALAGFLTGL
jgi:3-oxoadipate enol-lactonase